LGNSFFLNFLAVLGFECRASGRRSTMGATPPVLLCIGVFQDRASQTCLLGLASNCDPPDLCLLSS
jgi:hypothetical protein